MEQTLQGTVALVTGASSGIGEAIAVDLGRRGASVALTARREGELERVAGEIGAAGSKTLVVAADLTAEDGADHVVEATVGSFGRLDILVNNAGTLLLGPVEGAPGSEWERMVALNLMAVMRCSRAALPHLLTAAAGEPRQVADIVTIGSIAGRKPTPNTAVYDATKAAVQGFSESLRQEVAGRAVRVSLVVPGYVATSLAMGSRPEVFQQMAAQFDPGTPLQPSDVADAVHYLVSRPRTVAIHELVVRGTDQPH